MKWKSLIATVTLLTLFLTACGTNNKNVNETATRNPNQNEFRNVNYTPNGFSEYTTRETLTSTLLLITIQITMLQIGITIE